MKQSLLQYAEQSHLEREGNSPPLLRTVSRPASHCPLFDVKMETEHAWPSSNLLNGGGRYRAQYHNGAHLVMSDNRLLVVHDDGYFYCPPWGSPIHDACIQKQGPGKHSVLVVGLTTGVYLALIGETSPVQIVDDTFVTTRHPVEKVVFLRDDEVALCYGNADVKTYQFVLEEMKRIDLIPSRRQNSLRILEAVTSIWSTRRYRESAYDASSGRLFVLSNTDLTMWAHTATGVFSAVCSVAVPKNAVTVLPSFKQVHRHATLVLADGGRQPVLLEGVTTTASSDSRPVMRLGSVRPLPQDVRVDSVQLACQDSGGTTLLYDSRTCTLVMVTIGSPIYESVYDEVEVVSTLRLSAAALGVSCVSDPEEPRARFVVYGKSGILCGIAVRTLGFMVANIVQQQQQQGQSDVALTSLPRLGSRREMEAIAVAAFAGAAVKSLTPLLDELLRPSLSGSSMRLSAGAQSLICLVCREIAVAQGFWSAPFSWRLTQDLERVAEHLKKWHRALEELLRPHGWLDSPKQMELSWNALVATAPHPFTMRGALNVQAALLETVLQGLRSAGVLCWLYALLLRVKSVSTNTTTYTTTAESQGRLELLVWGENTETTITDLCMKALASNDSTILTHLKEQKDALTMRARHAISIHSFISANQPEAALTYASDNIKSLHHEQVMDYVVDKLEGAFPDRMPRLLLLLCWLKHSRSALEDLLGLLDRCLVNEPTEMLKRRLGAVMQAVAEDAALQNAVVQWMVNHPFEDSHIMMLAEVLEEHAVVINEPRTLTALFFICWGNRVRHPAVAARGFGDMARSKLRLSLSSRILCIKLALEYGPTTSEQLAYFVLLLQEELADAIEALWQNNTISGGRCSGDAAPLDGLQKQRAEADVDELRHFYVEERRLFELAGHYKGQGGAKVQLDLLKVHPETPEKVTAEVLQDLLEFLVSVGGMGVTDAVRNVVREYYDGYAAGLPVSPFVIFLAHHGEGAENIATLLQASGVPPYAVFDTFLCFFDERREGATFSKGAVATTLATTVEKLSGESRGLCAAYLLERIHNLLAGDPRATLLQLRESDVEQLQRAEAMLRRSFSISPCA